MSINHENPISYELHTKSLENQESIKKHTDLMVKEIQQVAGSDIDLRVSVEPLVKNRGLYVVTMNVNGVGHGTGLTVRKKGRQVLSTLKKARKVLLRRILTHLRKHRSPASKKRPHFRPHIVG